MSRKEIEHEARQRFILTKARMLFEEKGVENTNMEDIAAASDYTRRTLYTYFKSRDEISLMVLIDDLSARWAEQKEALKSANTGLEKIMVWANSLFEYTKKFPHSIRLQLFWDIKGIDRRLIRDEIFYKFEKLNDELAEGLREIFRLGLDDGSLRPDLQIDICISQFLYSLRNILNRAISTTYSFASFDPDIYVSHFLELFKRGIQNIGEKKV